MRLNLLFRSSITYDRTNIQTHIYFIIIWIQGEKKNVKQGSKRQNNIQQLLPARKEVIFFPISFLLAKILFSTYTIAKISFLKFASNNDTYIPDGYLK